MAAFAKYHQFVQDLANKVHDLGTDTLKVLLTDRAPLATDKVRADTAELAAGNGYPAGGKQVPILSCVQVGGLCTLMQDADPIFAAAGGALGPFRYAALYNSSVVSGPLIANWDFGEEITLADGQEFSIEIDPINGILDIQ